jgi:hypothetical protein
MLLASARFTIAAGRICRLTLGIPGLRRILERTGWLPDRYDDGPDRFLAVAIRTLAVAIRTLAGRRRCGDRCQRPGHHPRRDAHRRTGRSHLEHQALDASLRAWLDNLKRAAERAAG